MSVELKNNQFLSYVIVLLSLFILVLFTKDQVMLMQSNLDVKEQKNQELNQVREKQENLQKIALEVSQKDSVTKRYLKSEMNWENEEFLYSEDALIDYFYSYADEVSSSASWTLAINSINISNETQNELWFFEVSINVNAQVSSEAIMRAFLDHLISNDAKYKFFIESYYYPFDDRVGSFNMQLPLKVFYR